VTNQACPKSPNFTRREDVPNRQLQNSKASAFGKAPQQVTSVENACAHGFSFLKPSQLTGEPRGAAGQPALVPLHPGNFESVSSITSCAVWGASLIKAPKFQDLPSQHCRLEWALKLLQYALKSRRTPKLLKISCTGSGRCLPVIRTRRSITCSVSVSRRRWRFFASAK